MESNLVGSDDSSEDIGGVPEEKQSYSILLSLDCSLTADYAKQEYLSHAKNFAEFAIAHENESLAVSFLRNAES